MSESVRDSKGLEPEAHRPVNLAGFVPRAAALGIDLLCGWAFIAYGAQRIFGPLGTFGAWSGEPPTSSSVGPGAA